jgi:hypothetical protein
MTDELFYFYHIAHMAKHFMNGGCGIRPLLDLWILDNRLPGNEAKRGELLEREGLLVFSNAIKQLSRVWLCLESHNELTVKMQNYLLLGGIYGNLENRVKLQQVKSGGKRKYAIAKIFLPYEKIKHYYPILKKHKWLTPFMQVRRWFRIIFCGGFKRSVKELFVNERISDGSEETKEFLNQIGL